MLGMPLHHTGITAIHIAHIPLAAVRRHRVNSPMHHNAKLTVPKPVWVFIILLDRLPRLAIWPGGWRRYTFKRSGYHFGGIVRFVIRPRNGWFFHAEYSGLCLRIYEQAYSA